MFVSKNLDVNNLGHLTVGGLDAVALAERYGTPLYVMDEDLIRENCRAFKQSIDRYYDGRGLCTYASKAFCCKAVCRIAQEEGLGLDVVSSGELYTALQAGFPMERVYFHGNNKTPAELTMALESGVGQIVVDNLEELQLIGSLSRAAGRETDILFRIKPGIDAHTHDFIRTGQIDSKFGLALENGEAMEAVDEAMAMKGVRLKGLHCHIGSQIFDIAPFELAAEVMIRFMGEIQRRYGKTLEILDLGGGFGIKYVDSDNPSSYDEYMQRVSKVIHRCCGEEGLPIPYVVIEPGRSIVGPAGTTLYTVGSVKEIKNIRTYVAIDGGMTDNPRYALYQAAYDLLVANRAAEPKTQTVTVAGKCCESGDLIQENARIQEVGPGDILAVLATGAYNYSMASNYNRIPRPPVVMVSQGESRLVVRRESLEDLLRNDL
ncbi:diaminopimelate decarboxylase [Bittarella massiliensis (ex Durand et al. 2017)]|uniref:diaminopimelate decarboxylase n=1 Tax=Bittarella massiliensis (ex Durand et al. 2017) TaxID=1720313 RepID=UPI00073F9E9F|nr:diaminopimelate decarboxylase [Bittarella massiliensis (ex Durand et al. 2017)]